MSLNTACRVCLAMDVPVHIIAGSPLQNIYEKLTGISLNTAHRPVVACYMCYYQLRKSHSLMVRSLKAEDVLTHFLHSGDAVQGKSMSMLNQKAYQLRNTLSVTPTKIIDVTSTDEDTEVQVKKEKSSDDNLIEIEIKKEPMTSECIDDEEILLRSADRMKLEPSDDKEDASRKVLENIKGNSRTAEGDLKQEELHLSNCATHVQDISTEEMIHNKNKMLSLPPPTVVSVDWQREVNVKSNAFEEPASSAPVDTRESTVLPLRRFSTKIWKPCSTVKKNEIPRRYCNIRTYKTKRTAPYSDTTVNKSDVTIFDGDACSSTNTDVGNTNSEHSRRMFVCDNCGDVFDDKHLLIEHIEQHVTGKEATSQQCGMLREQKYSTTGVVKGLADNGMNRFECEICKAKFSQNYKLQGHLRIHTGEIPYECEICKVKFTYKCNLKSHLRIHTGEKPYECEICKVRFSHNYKLEKHFIIHTGLKPYECEICKVRLTEKSTLKAHLRKHTGEKPYKCDICEIRFSLKKSLRYHLKTHTGEKPYECEICKFRFIQLGSLKSHLRIHTGEKPYECDTCKVRFGQKAHLNSHLRTHTGEKPYDCEICKVRFCNKSYLKTHLRLHTGEKPYECDTCKARFTQKGHLQTHLRIHANKKSFDCEICNYTFTNKNYLKRHLRLHTGE